MLQLIVLMVGCLLSVQIVNGLRLDGSGQDVQFNKRLGDFELRGFYSVSLEACFKECERRLSCRSINYHRWKLVCQLNEAQTNFLILPLEKQPGYVFIEKKPHTGVTTLCGTVSCTENQVCDVTTNSCVFKECPSIEAPDRGKISGNMLSVGSKLSFECNSGNTLKYDNKYHVTLTSECLENGGWSVGAFECIPDCPSIHPPVRGKINGNSVSVGSKLSFECDANFVIRSNGNYHVTLESECQETSAWSIGGFACVPATCKVRVELNPSLTTGLYPYRDMQIGRQIQIFCDIRQGFGYTFVSKNDFGNISDISVHFTRTDYVILRHFRQDGTQKEASVSILPAYSSNYNITILLDSSTDFSSPRSSALRPYILLGFVPNSHGTKKGQIHGYKCNNIQISYLNCDLNNANYIAVFAGTTAQNYSQIGPGVGYAWVRNAETIDGTQYLPEEYFGLFEVGMGGCGAFITSDYDDKDNTALGASVGMRFDF